MSGNFEKEKKKGGKKKGDQVKGGPSRHGGVHY